MNTYNRFSRCSVTKSGLDRLPLLLLPQYPRCHLSRCRARPFQTLQLLPRYWKRSTPRVGGFRGGPSPSASSHSKLFQWYSQIRSFHHSTRSCGERVNTPLAPKTKNQSEHPVWFRDMRFHSRTIPKSPHPSKEGKADTDAYLKLKTRFLKSWPTNLLTALEVVAFSVIITRLMSRRNSDGGDTESSGRKSQLREAEHDPLVT